LGVALLLAGVVLVQTAWFKNLIRQRIVSVVQRATGGRVEIGSFSYNWHNLTADVKPFVLHGTEPASAPPLFRADKIEIGLKIISALEKKVDIASLIVESPRVYITIGPDGSTNIPRPKIPRFNQNVIEDLLDLQVRHIELRHGMADYNSWRVPLDATGEHLQMSLVYQPGGEPAKQAAGPRYLCAISSALMRVSSPKLRAPAEFALDSQVALGRNTVQVLRMNLASGGMKIESKGTIVNLYSPRGLRRHRRAPGAGPEQTGPDSAGAAWGFMVARPRHSRRIGHRSVYWKAHRALPGLRSPGPRHPEHRSEFARRFHSGQDQPDRISTCPLPTAASVDAAQLDDLKRVSVKGEIDGVTIAEVGRLAGRETGSLNGTLSGPVQLDGQVTPSGLAGVSAGATLDLKPGDGGVPVSGRSASTTINARASCNSATHRLISVPRTRPCRELSAKSHRACSLEKSERRASRAARPGS
jgi:translocation and assembly module TamB